MNTSQKWLIIIISFAVLALIGIILLAISNGNVLLIISGIALLVIGTLVSAAYIKLYNDFNKHRTPLVPKVSSQYTESEIYGYPTPRSTEYSVSPFSVSTISQ